MVTVKLNIPDELADLAREVAATTHRRVEDVLVEWLDRASSELPVESLPDEQVLALCDLQMDRKQQKELSHLLAKNREGELDEAGRARLDELMEVYQQGMVRKSEALRVAVQRGLRAPLSQP
jgi:hypothetical protein